MPSNEVQKFTLDNTEILVKDAQARQDMATFTGDLQSLQNRVTTLEGLSRLSVSYSSSTETIAFTTGTHSS